MTDAPSDKTRPLEIRGVFLEPLSRLEAGRWLLLGFGGFIMGQLFSAVFVGIAAALTGHSAQLSSISHLSSPPGWYVTASLVGLWIGFLGAPALAIRFSRPVERHLGLRVAPIDLVGIVIGLALQLVVGLLYQPFIEHLKHFNAPIEKLTGGSHGASFALIIAMTVLGAPIVEEIFFRGLLLRSLTGFATSLHTPRARTIGITVAVVADGLLFAASHGELIQLPGLALVGIVLSLLYLWTGRLGMSILAHVAFNGVAIAAYTSSGLVLWLH